MMLLVAIVAMIFCFIGFGIAVIGLFDRAYMTAVAGVCVCGVFGSAGWRLLGYWVEAGIA